MTPWRTGLGAALLVCGAVSGFVVWQRTAGDGPVAAGRAPLPPRAPHALPGAGRLSLTFEENVGQFDPAVRFLTRGPGYQLYFTSDGATWSLPRATPAPRWRRGAGEDRAEEDRDPSHDVLRMRLLRSRADARVTGVAGQAAKVHYFRGDDPALWRTNVPTFARVHYSQVYPGIDLEYYGRDGELEYDFVVAPGVDPGVIALGFEGTDRMSVDDTGNLVMETGTGRLVQRRPVAYQYVNGARRAVTSEYVLTRDHEVGFRLGEYDRAAPLVIDPVISYSTYLGGTGGPYGDQAYGIAVDPDDNIYVTGKTASSVFPAAGGQPVSADVYVLKMAPDGTPVYLAVINGNSSDSGEGIAVDAAGQVVVTGFTDSTNFPAVNPIQMDRPSRDAFLFKLDAAGVIVYSTYLGGSDAFDYGEAVVLDPAGNAYLTGVTRSADFPVLGALQPVAQGQDAFVVKVGPSGQLLYGTFLGGGGQEAAESIALDPDGSFYVVGWTTSSNFPRVQYPYAKSSGEDLFISRYVADGSAFIYSRYLGGNANERPYAVTPDGAGGVYVGGLTESTNYPTVLPLMGDQPGGDAFLTRLGSSGLVTFSTYLGGSAWERILGLAVRDGRLFATGQTFSTNFPTLDPVQPAKGGSTTGDAFVTTLDVASSTLVASTYLGGAANDEGRGVAPLPGGNVFIAGWTESTDFPIVRPIQDFKSNTGNIFITRIAPLGVDLVSPEFVMKAGGDALTITGQGFIAGATVLVGGVAASNVTVTSATTLTATAPALPTTGRVPVVVTNSDGNSGTLYGGVIVLDGTGPVADAGPDQAVEATGPSGTGVVLNGSASFDPDNEPLTYEWRDTGNNLLGTDAISSVTLPFGEHPLTLTVSDGHSAPSVDTVVVTIADTTAPLATVVSPNGANKLYTATPAILEWAASDAGAGLSTFDVYVSIDGGITYSATPVCAGVPATVRTCTWTTPGPATTKGRIRVTARDASGNVASDVSNANFSIVSGSAFVTVTAPNTTLNWGAGSTQQIKWSHNLGTSAFTRLELSLDGGGSWSLIHPGVQNTAGGSGVYNWVVPNLLTTTARIRASWVHGPVSDESNVNFVIANAYVQLSAPPAAGVNWGYGTRRTQKWTSNLGPLDRVNIVLTNGDGAPPVTVATNVLASAKTATFVTPTLASPTTTAQIQVVWSNPPAGFSASASSTGGFRIEPAFLTVIQPNGGELWTVDSSRTITWSHNLGSLENVRIDLSQDDGASYPVVMLASTPSDGAQAVTISSTWISTLARVRLTWLNAVVLADESNAWFEIR